MYFFSIVFQSTSYSEPDLLFSTQVVRLMRFGRIGHNHGHYAWLDDDYLRRYKISALKLYATPGIDVESMAPLTETNCVTPYRTRRHPLIYSPCFLTAASRSLSLSVPQAIIDLRCTNARLILRRTAEQRELCPLSFISLNVI